MNPKGSAITGMELRGELAFAKGNNMMNRRKKMEASPMSIPKGGGEVRRLHIIYFLSRIGRIEHPHLIRVHHLNRNGVYLRDVKRWMADLRGKDIPESFAWSYKRRYKNGYVWQDLLDDDLITPISDNEYVLKGSEIFPATPFDASTYGEKNVNNTNDRHKHAQVKVGIEDKNQEQQESSTIPTKTLSEIYQESPLFSSEGSTLTDDSITKQEQDESKHISHEQLGIDNFDTLSSSSFYSNLLAKKNKKNNKKAKNKSNNQDNDNSTSIELKMGSPNSSSSPQSQFAKSKSYSSGASKMLRNLMTCGAVDTNDAALVAINISASNKAEICTTRVFGNAWNPQQQQECYSRSFDGMKDSKKQQQQSGFCTSKGVPAAYKPVGAPTCSQCGKSFRPEKLHTHMKSCKGMKASAKSAAACVRKTPPPSMNSMNELIPIS